MAAPLISIIYPVDDLDAAKARFTALFGAEPLVDQPYYVGYDLNGVHVGLNPQGHQQGQSSQEPFWGVPDINAAVKALVDAGGTVIQAPQPVGGGRIVASVKDNDGNLIGLAEDGK